MLQGEEASDPLPGRIHLLEEKSFVIQIFIAIGGLSGDAVRSESTILDIAMTSIVAKGWTHVLQQFLPFKRVSLLNRKENFLSN